MVNLKHKKDINIICPYCNNKAKLVDGDIIYPHRSDLKKLKFYFCEPCNAFVGTHKVKSGAYYKPLGTLANTETRNARRDAHAVFDVLWRKKYMTRSEAYKWLGNKLGLTPEKCHIGESDIYTCGLIIEMSKVKLAEIRRKETKAKLDNLGKLYGKSKNKTISR